MKNKIIAVYSYETEKGESYFFGKKVISSPRNNSNTKIYKALKHLHFEPTIRSIKTSFCYNELDFNNAIHYLLGAGKFRYCDYKKFNSPF